MAERDLNFRVRADDQATRVFKDAQKAVKDLGVAEDDARTKAQQLADEMKAAADKIDAELMDAKNAAEVLGSALGDDLVADINAAGGSVDGMVATFKAAGLTYDDIRADADTLADAIKRVGDVGKVAGDDVKAGAAEAETGLANLDAQADRTQDSVRRVGDSGDQSRSVLANMVGNSTQDLAGLGGVAGTAGMALGQLGEYATEGGISLKGLAATAGPMLAVTAAVMLATKAIGDMKKRAEDITRQTKVWHEVNEAIADARFEEAAGKITDEWGGTIDVLTRLGYSGRDINAVLTGQKDITEELNDTLQENVRYRVEGHNIYNEEGEAIKRVIENLGEAQEAYTTEIETTKQRNEQIQLIIEAQGGETEAAKALKAALDEGIAATLEEIEAKRESIEASQNARDEQNRLNDAHLRGEDAIRRYRGELDKLRGDLDLQESYLALQSNIDTTIQKIYDTQLAFDEGTISAEENMRTQAQLWLDLKQEAIDYAEQLELTPKQVTTLVELIDNGQIAEYERQLGILTRNRTMNISILANGGALGGYTVRVDPVTGNAPQRALGGPTAAGGMYEVNERGSELLHENGRTYLMAGANGRVEPLDGDGVTMTRRGGDIYNISGTDAGIRRMIEQSQRDLGRRFRGGRR